MRSRPDERAVLALVQERARLLSLPGRREISYAVLVERDGLRYVAAQQRRGERESLFAAQRDVVARENAEWTDGLLDGIDHLLAKGLESGAHELHHNPAVVFVADE